MSKGNHDLVPTPPPGRRWIDRIRIRNFLAIENADIKVGNGLRITGRTGTGKTTILEALQAVFEKNARTKMVRLGELEGEIMLVMSDGTTATRKISDEKSERPRIMGPDRKPIGSPVEYLKKLAPALLFNPVRFVSMDETQQANILAEVFPVELSQAELETICGKDVELDEVEREGSGLDRANQAYKAAYKARHGANGELKQAEASRESELKKIPVGFDAENARGLSSETIAKELGRIETHNRLVVDGTNQMTKLEGEKNTLDTAIENLRKELAEKEAQLADVKTRMESGRVWLAQHTHIDPEPTQATLHTLDQQRMYLHCFDQAEAYGMQCREISARALRLDAIVATLKALPSELVRRSNIPIDGLTLEDGVIHIKGLPLSNLSTGERYRVATRIAVAGVKDLPIVCIDGAEVMSEVVRDQLIDDLRAEGIQVFTTEAEESDFCIRDLSGELVEAKVVIPERIESRESKPALNNASLPSPRVLTAPRTTSKPIATTAPAPVPVAKPMPALFDTSAVEEALFGEPTI